MKSLFKTIIEPEGDRYNNSVTIDGHDLIVNASINQADFKYVNRVGVVVEPPLHNPLVEVGDRVLVHHNVFRRYWGFSTHLRTSSSDLDNGTFSVDPDSLYAYNRGDGWKTVDNNIFIEPIEVPQTDLILDFDVYQERIGKLVYGAPKHLKQGDTVVFTPFSEHVFEFDGMKLYRMKEKDITAHIL